jgi:hypothetical protein
VPSRRRDAIAVDESLRISAYTAEPCTAPEDALNLLASWAATLDQAGTGPRDGRTLTRSGRA